MQEQKLKNKSSIKKWLKSMDIDNYTINNNLTVDVKGNVDLWMKYLNIIPVQFGTVTGNFDCSANNLDNLIGSPLILYGGLHCQNNGLKTLEGCTQFIPGIFDCSQNNLENLIGGPTNVGLSYECTQNKFKNIKGFPEMVGDYFICEFEVMKKYIKK